MLRIPTPATIEAAPAASQPLLQAVKKQLGVAPNLFRLVANSPAALEGYVSLSGALGKGDLPAATRERIALAVAEINGCDYCLSAHTYLGRHVAKLDEAQIIEIVQHVALNTWTNYINTVAQTEIDFPVVKARQVA
jgi:AhpD family alkylhydroperoxidase